jgi:hypothetical protein
VSKNIKYGDVDAVLYLSDTCTFGPFDFKNRSFQYFNFKFQALAHFQS